MKTVKIFLLVLAVLMGFISCEDSNAIDSENNSQKSAALRTVLNELKLTNNIAGRSAARDSISNSCTNDWMERYRLDIEGIALSWDCILINFLLLPNGVFLITLSPLLRSPRKGFRFCKIGVAKYRS